MRKLAVFLLALTFVFMAAPCFGDAIQNKDGYVDSSNPLDVKDSQLPTAAALADNTANPTTTGVAAYQMLYDGSTWDRMPGNSADGITSNTELAAAAALSDDTATPTVPAVGSFGMLYDGTTWDMWRGDATNGALVDLGANNDVKQGTHDNFNANANLQVGDSDVSTSNPVPVATSTYLKEITLSLDDSGAYADGDVLADTQEITSAVRANGGTGVIHSVMVLDKDDQGQPLDLVFLQTDVSIGTENSAVSVTDTNADEILGIVSVAAADYVDLVNSQLAPMTNLGTIVEAAAASTSLFIAAISRGTGTYSTSGITLKIGILVD